MIKFPGKHQRLRQIAITGAILISTLLHAPKARGTDFGDLGIEPIDADAMRSYMTAHYRDIQVHGGVSIGLGAVGMAAGAYLLLRPPAAEHRKISIPLLTFGVSQIVVGSLLVAFPPPHVVEAGGMLTNDPDRFITSEQDRASNLYRLLTYGVVGASSSVLIPMVVWLFSDEFKKTWQPLIVTQVGEGLITWLMASSLQGSLEDYQRKLFGFELNRALQSPGSPQPKPMLTRPIMFKVTVPF